MTSTTSATNINTNINTNNTNTCSTKATSDNNAIVVDNPCWGSCTRHDLTDLLQLLCRSKAILYESEHYLVLNKPPDLRMDGAYPATVHKLLTYWYPPTSLLLQQQQQQRQQEEEEEEEKQEDLFLLNAVSKLSRFNDLKDNPLRPCHQLDYATSGILFVARSQKAASYCSMQWEDRQVYKSYLAVIHGRLLLSKQLLPSIPNTDISQFLQRLEQSYRKKRQKPANNLAGFQPPHAMFHKWKSLQKKRLAKKKKDDDDDALSNYDSHNNKTAKRKRKENLSTVVLSDEQWDDIYQNVNKVIQIPENNNNDDEATKLLLFLDTLDWKQLCKTNVEWKRAFQQASTKHNNFLRTAIEAQNEEGKNPIIDLPTIFLGDNNNTDDDDDDDATNSTDNNDNKTTTVYIYCPLAQVPDDFAMRVPPEIAQQYPHMQPWAGAKNLDYKPSLTKCTILQTKEEASYNGQPVTKVQLWPMTGRRHQLRVHMALLQHAILGDATYYMADDPDNATASRLPPRMCLHAHSLSLRLLGQEDKMWTISSPEDPFEIVQGQLQLSTI